ncbi:MAG: hypothetical protein MI799_24530 [Desulfobacterales bacterium]|nr:hypothetical protein [Desulfobacterales bacterium]
MRKEVKDEIKAEKPGKKNPPIIRQPDKKDVIFPVEDLAKKQALPGWETAALMRSVRWAPGKQVSEADFTAALEKFRSRPQGGGRI